MAPSFEFDLAARDMEQSVAERIGFERVGTPEVDRGAGRRFAEKEPRDGLDLGIDCTARQRQAMIVGARRDEPDAASRLHLNLTDASYRDQGARGIVRLQPLADMEPSRRGNRLRAD